MGCCTRRGPALPFPPLLVTVAHPLGAGPPLQGLDPRPSLSPGHLMTMTAPLLVLTTPLKSSCPNLRPSLHPFPSAGPPAKGQEAREDFWKKKLKGSKWSSPGALESRCKSSQRSCCLFFTPVSLYFFFLFKCSLHTILY